MRNSMKQKFKRFTAAVLSVALGISVLSGIVGIKSVKTAEAATSSTSVSGVSTITSGLTDDFIKGVDISEVIALEKSGASFKYLDGSNGDIFSILKGAGVNYIRIRVWNNPYDSSESTNYKGYGGGNCDLYNAKILGDRATKAGMKVLIDFHYSDFWADPEKQFEPKAWKDYSLAYKKDAVYNWTYSSLQELLEYGVDVEMVQIGNETNGSMCGIGGSYDNCWDLSSGVADLMKQGCYAVDDINSAYEKSILKCLHFTDFNNNGAYYAKCLNTQGVDYDVFATSYYPMWHGTTSDLAKNLKSIASTYNKKVMVAETAYPYTYDNFDTTSNNVGSSSSMSYTNYEVSVSGQAEALRDVFAAVAKVNSDVGSGYGLGAFYWAPEWIAVDSSTWGTYGSGWASSTSGNYELLYSSKVNYYSKTDKGSSWDNMTLFDSDGQAMKSLYVFNDISGTESQTSPEESGTEDTDIFWTGTVTSTYNGNSFNGYSEIAVESSNGITLTNDTWSIPVTFDSDALSKIKKMGQPTLKVTRSGSTTIWGFGIANSSWEWLAGSETSETTDTTYSIDLDTSVSYILNNRDWNSSTLSVTVTDADPANATTGDDEEEETTGEGYLNITEDIAGYVGDIIITVNYTGNSSWANSWINLMYYDATSDSDITLQYALGEASGEGTLSFSITAEELATLQSSSYVQIKASYDNTNAKYTAFIDSASVFKPYVLYTQKTDVVDGKYSQRWVELIPEEDMNTYAKGTLVITRTNDNKKMTVTLTKCYNSVSAAGETLTAPAGYKYLAYALLNIPEDINLSATEIVFTEE